jgi:hypothetical protein
LRVASFQFVGCQLFRVRYSELGEVGLEGVEERGEGSAAMAEGEFGFDVEFGHGLVLIGQVEEGIVAETAGATRGGEDFAFDGAMADAEDLSVADCCEDAVIAGCWISVGDFAEGFEEAEVVALVGCSNAEEVFVFGVAGGADAGCSIEGVDFEAGVVGDDDFAGSVMGVVDGFEAGVAFEGGFVFGGSGDFFYAGEWREGDVLRCCGGEVAKLAGVGGGDVEL